jgi:hypothetical protein
MGIPSNNAGIEKLAVHYSTDIRAPFGTVMSCNVKKCETALVGLFFLFVLLIIFEWQKSSFFAYKRL